MPLEFEQLTRIVTEQAEEVVQVFNRSLWIDAYSANREYVFSFAPLGIEPPFEIIAESHLRWDINQLFNSFADPRMMADEEGGPVDENYLDLEIAVMLPPFSALPKFPDMRALVSAVLPQYNPPIFHLAQDYNIDAPGETVYHLKLDYLWSFEGENRIMTARFADIYNDMGLLMRELNRARGGWETVHYT